MMNDSHQLPDLHQLMKLPAFVHF